MEYIIKGRKPESFFGFFEEISAIPRESYHEEKIADYLVNFAKARGLEYYRDEANNVLIKKPATKGQEHRPPILFQGHTDMVCEKDSDVKHDFLNDPLELYVDGNLLRARGTTLGADDGVAVAMMLSLLDGMVAEHPALECLFSATEEVGMVGALQFDFSRIKARTLINMDAGDEKYPLISCSGAFRTKMTLPVTTEPMTMQGLRVRVSGLIGGHSGAAINKGRANANKLMGRLLAVLTPTCDARIVSVDGGSKSNAIPRECEAVLAVPDFGEASAVLKNCAAEIATELVPEDRDFTVTVEPAAPARMMSREDTARVCGVLACLATGVFSMCRDLPYLVEYSRNFAVVATDTDAVTFTVSTRSARNSKLDASAGELDAFAAMIGAKVDHYDRYPGWEYDPNSKVREVYCRAYRETTGEEATPVGVHAGIECGVIRSAIPDMDAIAISPNHANGHSPSEQLDLDSCERMCRIVARMIEIL